MKSNSLEQYIAIFTYSNRKCDCNIEQFHDENNKLKYLIFMNFSDNISDFFYSPESGLNCQSMSDSKLSVTEEFASLSFNNTINSEYDFSSQDSLAEINKLKKFIERYGFFFDASNNSALQFDLKSVVRYLQYIQTIINLHLESTKESPDYNLIFNYVLMLHLIPTPEINCISNSPISFDYLDHPLSYYWTNISALKPRTPDSSCSDSRQLADFPGNFPALKIKDYFCNNDLYIPEINMLTPDDCNLASIDPDVLAHQPNIILFNKIFYLFSYYQDNSPNHLNKRVIDFLYHYVCLTNKSFLPDSIDYNYKLAFLEGLPKSDAKTVKLFKDNLLEIAKDTVKVEFDFLLSHINIEYNSEVQRPTWKITNLITALILSIFYIDSSTTFLKKCQNPTCPNTFIVSRSNSKKMYCCDQCNNIVQQRKYRQKHLAFSPKKDSPQQI